MRPALQVLTFLVLPMGLLPALSQGYLDGRDIIRLSNQSRYGEAFELARSRPNTYGQWAAYMIRNKTAPSSPAHSRMEAFLRGYAEACRYMAVNKEAEALCYLGILDLHGRQIMYPETSSFPKGVKLPRISPQRAMEALELLKKEGVPYAEYVLQKPRSPGSPSDKEKSLQLLAERYPYSLGGALAAGELAVILWQKGRYPEALRMAQPLVGIIPNAGGVVAWAEFTGQGARQNRESACRKAQFWSVRFPVSPATYTLGLCYLEGVGGLPKDPLEAYALFWLANYLGCCHPGLEQALKGLESSLTPAQALEARRRAVRYLP